MNRNKISTLYKNTIITLGGVFFACSLFYLETSAVGYGFIALLALAVIFARESRLKNSHSKFALSFSDAIVFCALLLYGGAATIVLSAFASVSAGVYLYAKEKVFKWRNFSMDTGLSLLSTTATFFIWFSLLNLADIKNYANGAITLTIALIFLAIARVSVSYGFSHVLNSLSDQSALRNLWHKEAFFNSLSRTASAIFLAGIVFSNLQNGDFLTITLSTGALAIIYAGYRKTVENFNDSLFQVEREKAEIEQKRVGDAELNIAQVNELFTEQEQLYKDLQISREALDRAAYYDPLTGIFNRTYLIERLELLLDMDIDIANKYYVLFLDINRFKNINDSLGHPVGDKVLISVAKRLKRILRDEDTISRLGGDEYAIILNDLSSIEEAEYFARRIHQKLTQPYSAEGHKIYIDLDIGISPFDLEHSKPEDILRDADIAMHHAKENNLHIGVFDKELRRQFLEKVKLESELRFAVKRNELALYFQPVVQLTDGSIVGFEALLRWQHPKYGFISPAKFIPIAEESGLIIPITKWILLEACNQMAAWKENVPNTKHLKISINISGKHLADENLPDQVQSALVKSGLEATSLILEITESSAMQNAEQTIRIFQNLRKIGIAISIDDFGTGYSSLSYLHRLPFDSLKIDRSFVSDVQGQNENAKILQTIVSLAQNLNLRTVAEGIETFEQLKILQNLECDLGQGFLFSKPLPKEQAETLLYQKLNWIPADENTNGETTIAPGTYRENLHVF